MKPFQHFSISAFSIFLLASATLAPGQQTIRPVQHTNGVLVSPTNLWLANSNAINAIIAGGGGGGGTSDWNALSNIPTWITAATWQTNPSAPLTTNAGDLSSGTLADARLSTNIALRSALPSWSLTTTPATARTDLQLGTTNAVQFGSVTASNVTLTTLTNATGPQVVLAGTNGQFSTGSVPSGAAPLGAVQTADGAGGSSFVASRTVVKWTTNDQTKTSWTNLGVSVSTNSVPELSFSVDANSIYRVEYNIEYALGATNAGWQHVISGPLATPVQVVGIGGTPSVSTDTIRQSTAAAGFLILPATINGSSQTNRIIAGSAIFRTATNSGTVTYNWAPVNTDTNFATLKAMSTVVLTKLAP